MMTLDRILVPVDLGPDTDAVVRMAGHIARPFGATLRLLYVVDEVPHFKSALELIQQAARERLEALERDCQERGLACDPVPDMTGRPFDAIVRAADALNAHLIVMGRGGSAGEARAGLGMTTARVMRRTSKPVLTVQPGASGTIQRVLCPVDGSNPSARGLQNAILLCRALDARLTVLSVVTDFSLPLDMSRRAPEMAKLAADYEAMEREQFQQFLKGFDFTALAWDKEVHYGRAADQIVRLANDAKYDLVVMGSTGRSGLPRVLLGSTAEAVARRVACSVLTVKREDVLATKSEAEVGEISQWLAEGRRLLDQARYEEALTRFDRCLLRDPYLATAIELAGTAHERLGNQEMAHELRTQAELIRHRLWQQPTDRHVTIV